MSILGLLQQKKDEIHRIAALHGGRSLAVFGSCARGEDNPDSDIDLLVEFSPDTSLFDFVALKYDLEILLHRKVDIVSKKALSEDEFGKTVIVEAVAI